MRAVILTILLSFSSIAVVGAQENTPDVATPSAESTPSPSMPRLELDLEELNDSGIMGTVTLYDVGNGKTIVEFDVEGAGGDHPAHIHAGVCGDLEPEPFETLDNVDDRGESTTVIDVSLDDLLADDYAVDMHLAPDELGTLIACADIEGEPELPLNATPESTPEAIGTKTSETDVGGTIATEEPTPTTESGDGTSGAVSTETPVATEPSGQGGETSTVSSVTPTEPTATEETKPATSTKPVSGDGTTGAGSSVPTQGQTTTTVVGGDGTAGVSGKGEPVSTSTLPQQAGVGTALAWPTDSSDVTMWVSVIAAIALGTSAWFIRRGEQHTTTTPSRWSRLGI